jgi:ankyrin repeat protein
MLLAGANAHCPNGNTALLLAAVQGYDAALAASIHGGENVHATYKDGDTALIMTS